MKIPTLVRNRTECRWVRIENIHMTLFFLGEISQESVSSFIDGLSTIGHYPSHEQSLNQPVAFPSLSNARVAGIGGEPASPSLLGLVGQIRGLLEGLNCNLERRNFVPHITLVRFRVPLKLIQSEFTLAKAIPYAIKNVTLFKSHLNSDGARYEVLKDFPLAAGPA